MTGEDTVWQHAQASRGPGPLPLRWSRPGVAGPGSRGSLCQASPEDMSLLKVFLASNSPPPVKTPCDWGGVQGRALGEGEDAHSLLPTS